MLKNTDYTVSLYIHIFVCLEWVCGPLEQVHTVRVSRIRSQNVHTKVRLIGDRNSW